MAQHNDSETDPAATEQVREERQIESNKVLRRKHEGATTHRRYLDRDRLRKSNTDEGQSR